MGHIAHLRNQFISINTFAQDYEYIITLIWRGLKTRCYTNTSMLEAKFKIKLTLLSPGLGRGHDIDQGPGYGYKIYI